MKKLITIAALTFFSFSYGQKIEEIKIPSGVVYNYCDNQTIEKAKQLISESLADSTKFTLSQDLLIVGPQLWTRFKEIKRLNEIEGGKVVFQVDNLELAGKLTQDLNNSKKIWDEFRKEVGGNYTIRKANEQELTYYWSVISFDIDEPLLIVETAKHNYILNIVPKDLKLMWLDEAPIKKGYYNPIEDTNYEASNGFKAYQNGVEVDSISIGFKETKLEKIVLLSSDEDLKNNSSVEDITEIIERTSKIFDELFKSSEKSGKIMIQFELKKRKNEISFAIKDDIDLAIMAEFEKRINKERFPNSRKEPVKIQIIYKVNSFNETN